MLVGLWRAAIWLTLSAALLAQEPLRPSIRVRTVDLRGLPLADVEVSIADAENATAVDPLGRTGVDGMLVVTDPRAIAAFVGRATAPVLRCARRGRATTVLALTDDIDPMRGADLGDVAMAAGMNRRGVVHDERGKPVAGAVVRSLDALTWRMQSALGNADGLTFARIPGAAAEAITDANGRFELVGASLQGLCVQVMRLGYAESLTAPLGIADRLEITLRETGVARGTVVDAEDRPMPGELRLIDAIGYEVTSRAGADGRFEIGLPSRAPFLIDTLERAYDPDTAIDATAWIAAPRDDLRVRVPIADPGTEPATPIAVRVLDGRTSEPIPGARAGVVWEAMFVAIPPSSARLLTLAPLGEPASDGVPSIGAPSAGGDLAGLLHVAAPDHVSISRPIRWDTETRTIEVRLTRAARVRGIVVDAVSGGAVAGALVSVVSRRLSISLGEDPVPIETVSGDDGGFDLGGLEPGPVLVSARLVGRPTSESRSLQLRPWETVEGIELGIPLGLAVQGQLLVPTGTVDGLWVMVEPRSRVGESDGRTAVFRAGLAIREGRASRVAPDGSFRIAGLRAGRFAISAFATSRFPGIPRAPVPVGEIELDSEDVAGAWTAPGVAGARLTGSVAVEGADLPHHRLAVVAWLARQDGFGGIPSEWVVPDPTGSYELRLFEGEWVVAVLDVVTGVQFVIGESVTVAAGASIERDFRIVCGAVRVLLPPLGPLPPRSRILRIARADAEALAVDLTIDSSQIVSGLEVPSDRADTEVFLPCEPFDLHLDIWRIDRVHPFRSPHDEVGGEVKTLRVLAERDAVREVRLGGG